MSLAFVACYQADTLQARQNVQMAMGRVRESTGVKKK
jgi:hypothetical protein